MHIDWFLFDLGNTLIRLAYDRVLTNIAADAAMAPAELIELLEAPGGYRDMERGALSFDQFHAFLRERAGYRAPAESLRAVWSDFFDGPVAGAEELLARIRARYRVAFLSNSNEVHEEVIPEQFPMLFRPDDTFVFSHRVRVAKPDAAFYRHALETLHVEPQSAAFVDDLLDNVMAARAIGMIAFHFVDTETFERELVGAGLL